MIRGKENVTIGDTSHLQRRLDEIAHLRQLGEEGIHTDSLIKQEDPTLGKVIFTRAIHELHKRFTTKLR